MTSIRIDLDAAADGSGGEGNSLRKDTFTRVLVKLLQPIPSAGETKGDQYTRPPVLDVMKNRRHDAILVSARRGDGKTTFLTDLLALAERHQSDGTALRNMLSAEYPQNACSLYSLGIIDPTLIENKQNIVIIIIQKIKEAVDRHYEVVSPGEDARYDEFKKHMHVLAGGLTLLDGIGEDAAYGKDWADPDFIMETGLDRAKAASAFEPMFHKYVEKACEFIKRDAFLLAIDDVDTWFERGWPVLEALRKYLATPRLKIVMAGDMSLYSLLVRQRQWKQITREFVEIEAGSAYGETRRRQLEDMVDTLQDQYLIKIAAPENRFDLKPLLFYAQDPGVTLLSSRKISKEIAELDFMRDYARLILALTAREDRDTVRSILLRLPLRSTLQVLSGAWRLVTDEAGGSDARSRQAALDALRYVASTWLTRLDLDGSALRDAGPTRIFGILAHWMTKQNLWSTMPRFHPDDSDDGRNLVTIYVAGTLVEIFRANPASMIDYWIRMCTIREYADSNLITALNVVAMMQHLRVGTNEKTLQFASRLASWEASGSGSGGRQLTRGTRLSSASVPAKRLQEPASVQYELYGIRGTDSEKEVLFNVLTKGAGDDRKALMDAISPPLRGYHRALEKAQWSYASLGTPLGITWSLANSLQSLRQQLDPDAIMVLGLGAMQVVSGQQSENGVYSFLRILASVAEVFELGGTEHSSAGEIEALLARHAQIRSYPSPNATQADALDDGEVSEEESQSLASLDRRVDDQAPIADQLAVWLASIEPNRTRMALAPVTLARIWTRFTYASSSILAKLQHLRSRYLGVLMHRTIIAFLHAVGAESLRASGETLGTKMVDNPIETAEPFAALLERIAGIKSEDRKKYDTYFLMFEALFTCPLWGYFLARSDDYLYPQTSRSFKTKDVFDIYRDWIQKQTGSEPVFKVKLSNPKESDKDAEFDGLYFLLNTLQLQGQKPTRSEETTSKSAVTLALQKLGAEVADPVAKASVLKRRRPLRRT